MAFPFALLAAAIPAVAKAGYLLTNKPKESDYRNKYAEGALDRIIANNQADVVNKTLYNQMTRSAKSLGARLYQQQQHGLDIGREQGLLTSGQHARALLQGGTDIQSQVGQQEQTALLENTKYTSGLQQNIDDATLKLGALKDQARKEYLSAKQQHTAALWGSVGDIASMATSITGRILEDNANKKWMDNLIKEHGKPEDWVNNPDKLDTIMVQLLLRSAGF